MWPRAASVFIPAACLLAGLSALSGCQRQEPDWRFSGETMGTSWHVSVRPEPGLAKRKQLRPRILEELEQVDRMFSGWREDSELSRFNQAAVGDWVAVSSATVEVARRAQELAAFTRGAFDPTVTPLVELWGFGPKARETPVERPPESEQQARLAQVGYWRFTVRRQPPALRKNTAVQLDFSAIAKGHAVDRIAQALDALGARHYLAEIGGEVRVRGQSPRQSPWRIGIAPPEPEDADKAPQAVQLPSGMALATSGDYHNYHVLEGRRHPHIIDPYTGAPSEQGLASVTVAADTAARADALATALLVMGAERGLQFAEQNRIAAFFMERRDDSLHARHSSAFAPFLE